MSELNIHEYFKNLVRAVVREMYPPQGGGPGEEGVRKRPRDMRRESVQQERKRILLKAAGNPGGVSAKEWVALIASERGDNLSQSYVYQMLLDLIKEKKVVKYWGEDGYHRYVTNASLRGSLAPRPQAPEDGPCAVNGT